MGWNRFKHVVFDCGLFGIGRRSVNSDEELEVWPAICDKFVGQRSWGLNPEPWRRCMVCNWPRNQHQLPGCSSKLSIAGKTFKCDLTNPHEGASHSNFEAQAVWQ